MSIIKKPSVNPTKVEFSYSKQSLVRLIMEGCQNMVKIVTDQSGNVLVDEYSMNEDTPTLRMKQKLMESPLTDIVNTISLLTTSSFEEDYKHFLLPLNSWSYTSDNVTTYVFTQYSEDSNGTDKAPVASDYVFDSNGDRAKNNNGVYLEVKSYTASPSSITVGAVGDSESSNYTTYTRSANKDEKDIVIPLIYVSTYNNAHLQFMYDSIKDMLVYGALVQWFSMVNADGVKTMCEAEYAKAKTTLMGSIKALYRKVVFNKINNYTISNS